MYKYILFDLDGTLTDSFEGITKCVQYALNSYGIKDEPLEKLKVFIGPALKDSFMSFYGFSEEDALAATAKYRERFKDIGIYENKVYDGIPELLKKLKEKGYVMAIASSKPTVFVERILEYFNIKEYFSCVMGSLMNGIRGKKCDVIQAVFEELKITDKSQVLMVGDRLHDVEGAKQMNVDCLGVSYGFGGREELETAGATYVVDTVEEMEALLLNYVTNE